jgi:hypothetical protein
VRAALEQENLPAALRQLAGDDAAPGARPDDNDLVRVLNAIPR